MSSAPVFVGTPKTWHINVAATANTNRDGTGTLATLMSAGSSGSRIDSIRIQSVGTVTAGVVRIFITDGTNIRLHKELLVTATTPSTTVEAWSREITFSGFVLPTGWGLRVSTHNAEAFNAFAFGGDL